MLISIVGRRQMAGRGGGGGLMVEKGGGVEMFDVFLFENLKHLAH